MGRGVSGRRKQRISARTLGSVGLKVQGRMGGNGGRRYKLTRTQPPLVL